MCNASTGCGPNHAFFGPFDAMAGSIGSIPDWRHFMPYELQETNTSYFVVMPLPGFATNEVGVSVSDNTIYIEAHRKKTETQEKEENKPEVIVSWGRPIWDRQDIEVSIPLQHEIETESVKAKLNRGILNITFLKKPRKSVSIDE
jgi:HSP20 family molecular chaperone IbpA